MMVTVLSNMHYLFTLPLVCYNAVIRCEKREKNHRLHSEEFVLSGYHPSNGVSNQLTTYFLILDYLELIKQGFIMQKYCLIN